MSELPVVSVVMPCYNAAEHVARAIETVMCQTFSDWELIVVDDGSVDGTAAIVQGFSDPRIRLLQQRNTGVSAARNRGVGECRGELVAFLDSDDTWAPRFLARMIEALTPDAVLAYCGWQNLGLSGPAGDPYIPPLIQHPDKLRQLLYDCPWPIHAALTRRSSLAAAGGFDVHLKNAEDYLLWLELAAWHPIVRVSEVLAYYHFHGGTQATKNAARAARQTWMAKQQFIARHPEIRSVVGLPLLRELVHGRLMQKGFEHYWRRELAPARDIFRTVMRTGYGSPSDWLHMLPAFLPLALQKKLLNLVDTKRV
jgi:glycosyltransferase involved in cell wall biosynthesis